MKHNYHYWNSGMDQINSPQCMYFNNQLIGPYLMKLPMTLKYNLIIINNMYIVLDYLILLIN